MLKNIKTYYLTIILFSFILIDLTGQAPKGEFREIMLLDNGDTVRMDRQYGDWWFGAFTGVNGSYDYGDLRLPKTPSELVDSINFLMNFDGAFGGGFYIGLIGEWLPPGEHWGAMLRVSLFDSRSSSALSQEKFPDLIRKDSLGRVDTATKRHYESDANYTYLSFSPSARYNFNITGLHAWAGLDIELLIDHEIANIYKHENTSPINEYPTMEKSKTPIGFRYGFNAGVGYDFLLADINHFLRLHLSPFFSIHAGSGVFDQYGSSRNEIHCKAGFALKFGPDNIYKDTSKYNPEFIEPPAAIATIQYERNVYFPGFKQYAQVSEYLTYREPTIGSTEDVRGNIASLEFDSTTLATDIDTDLPDVPTPGVDIPDVDIADIDVPTEEPVKKSTFKARTKKTLTFTSRLGRRDKEFLDELALYLMDNPRASVQIVGHSSDAGTFEENQLWSDQRASAVVRYLQKKKISKGRLLNRGVGSQSPKFSNSTRGGRKRNNRVDVRVVQ